MWLACVTQLRLTAWLSVDWILAQGGNLLNEWIQSHSSASSMSPRNISSRITLSQRANSYSFCRTPKFRRKWFTSEPFQACLLRSPLFILKHSSHCRESSTIHMIQYQAHSSPVLAEVRPSLAILIRLSRHSLRPKSIILLQSYEAALRVAEIQSLRLSVYLSRIWAFNSKTEGRSKYIFSTHVNVNVTDLSTRKVF